MQDDKETRVKFAGIMMGLAENYGQTITQAGAMLRFEALKEFSLESIQKAALDLMKNRKYTSMPTVADFLEFLGGGNVEDRAQAEAGKVLDAIRRHGRYDSVVFDDPVTMAVVYQAYGGWVQLCSECGVEESEHWFRNNFAKYYASYFRQGMRRGGHLPGLAELDNAGKGLDYFIPQPQLVGNPEAAKLVLAAGEDMSGAPYRGIACGIIQAQELPYEAEYGLKDMA